MTDAPERIWAYPETNPETGKPDWDYGGFFEVGTAIQGDLTEYIRADLVDTKPDAYCHQQDLTTERARQAGFAEGVEAAARLPSWLASSPQPLWG